MDVDSTLIQDEVIELLAEHAGVRDAVAAVTDSAMRGEIDFAESLRQRVATLAGLNVSVLAETYERVRLSEGAEQLISYIHANGGRVGAVSGGFSQILEPLANRLSLDFYRANDLEIVDGALTGKVSGKIIDRAAKSSALIEWAALSGVPLEDTAAIGDGANDLDMFETSGISFAFNAKPAVREAADVVVDIADLSLVIPHL